MLRLISKLDPLSIEVIAPAHRPVEGVFADVIEDPQQYRQRLTELQQFRGHVYTQEGFLRRDALDRDGRHVSSLDPGRWHLLICDQQKAIKACLSLRLFDELPELEDLYVYDIVRRSAGANLLKYRHALLQMIERSRERRVMFGEVGGWAVSPDVRNGAATVTTVLGAWALMRFVGEWIGVATVGKGRKAERVLSKLGGFRLPEGDGFLPHFFDSDYNSNIEILAFDSRQPCPEAIEAIHCLRRRLMDARIYAATPAIPDSLLRNRAIAISVLKGQQAARRAAAG
jgi:hypothetical protein